MGFPSNCCKKLKETLKIFQLLSNLGSLRKNACSGVDLNDRKNIWI